MLRFHLKVFLKTLLKNKLLSLINLTGLALGFTVSILVLVFVSHELSYDDEFKSADRICRVIRNWQGSEKYGTDVSAPLAGALRAGIPEIIAATRLYCSRNNIILKDKDIFREKVILVVDSSFFEVFGIGLQTGNADHCLTGPGSVVISRSAASRLFHNSQPLGESIVIESGDLGTRGHSFSVTGVYEDFPESSHMRPDFLLSSSSFRFIDNPSPFNHFLQTYVLLESAGQRAGVEEKLPGFMKEFYGPEYYDYSGSTYLLQPIKDIHLNPNVYYAGYETSEGSYATVYFFPVLAVFIMIITLVNYVNLHTSQSLCRRKEIWLKKIFGASNLNELFLLVLDSILLCFAALAIAICLVELCFPAFERLTERQLDIGTLYSPLHALLGILTILVLGTLSGIYPAMVLISSNALNDKNMWSDFRTGGVFFSSRMIILQFALCIFFLISSFFVYKQFRYVNLETNRGLTKDNILLIKNPWYLRNSHAAFKDALMAHSSITDISSSENVPGIDQFSVWGHPVDSAAEDCHITVIYCDYAYANTLKLNLIRGRFFSPEYSNDNLAIVLNQAAVKKLGWADPIGKRYRLDTVYRVIGVVQDIHYESLHNKIEPMGMILIEPGSESFISMRIAPGHMQEATDFVKATWEMFVPDRPVELSFVDREFDFWYRTDRKMGIVTAILSVIAVIISCMGLLGLMIYTTIRRTKEIGIRKVNGANSMNIVSMFLLDTSKWLLVALFIAIPISWFAINKWLQSFAYKTTLSWWVFILAGLVVFLIAIGTIAWQSYKAATCNPVDSLRYE
jgi:putative ABC transport system permease protein